MADQEQAGGGFWRTFPGVVTAVAGLLTAVGGLVVALRQAGVIGGLRGAGRDGTAREVAGAGAGPATTTGGPAGAGVPPSTSTPGGVSASGAAAERALPTAGLQAKVAEAVFRVVSARVVGVGGGQSELRLRVQVENTDGSNYMSIASTNFRLRLSGGLPLAPSEEVRAGYLDPRSGGAFDVIFLVPDTARAGQLTFRHDQRMVDRTVDLNLGDGS